MRRSTMFSSATCEWETPQALFDKLNAEFNFNLDVCATPDNAKCEKFYTKKEDGLLQPWNGACWMNPPYGREIKSWMSKAHCESTHYGVTVVCLVPSRTDTFWWHEYCMKGEIRFIKGRVKFGGNKNNAPFPSAIVIFKNMEGRYAPINSEKSHRT